MGPRPGNVALDADVVLQVHVERNKHNATLAAVLQTNQVRSRGGSSSLRGLSAYLSYFWSTW